MIEKPIKGKVDAIVFQNTSMKYYQGMIGIDNDY